MCIASKPPKDRSAEIARQQEEERQARIREGRAAIDSHFSQFDDPYFNQYQTAYLDYYQPQLDRQYQDARRKLVLGLHQGGGLQSSAGASRLAELQSAYAEQQNLLGNRAMDAVNDLRGRIEAARNDLYSQNRASADPSAVASAAAAQAGILSNPPSFSPLGNVFSTLTDFGTLGLAAERAGYPGFNTGIFSSGSSKGSSKVVR